MRQLDMIIIMALPNLNWILPISVARQITLPRRGLGLVAELVVRMSLDSVLLMVVAKWRMVQAINTVCVTGEVTGARSLVVLGPPTPPSSVLDMVAGRGANGRDAVKERYPTLPTAGGTGEEADASTPTVKKELARASISVSVMEGTAHVPTRDAPVSLC
jgi:hypothetical protein